MMSSREDLSAHEVNGQVLLAEDHRPTSRLLTAAFEELQASISTSVVRDADECLAKLRSKADSPADPDILLLDLNLANSDGFTVLEATSEDPGLRQTPIIVLSGRDDQQTVNRCYAAGANAFIAKPDDFDGFLRLARRVAAFWFVTTRQPGPPPVNNG